MNEFEDTVREADVLRFAAEICERRGQQPLAWALDLAVREMLDPTRVLALALGVQPLQPAKESK